MRGLDHEINLNIVFGFDRGFFVAVGNGLFSFWVVDEVGDDFLTF